MNIQISNWTCLEDSFWSLSKNRFGGHAILTTKIVRRTLTPERAMSGALFAGRCQVWPSALSSHHQVRRVATKTVGTPSGSNWVEAPPALVERKIRLAVQSAWCCWCTLPRIFNAFFLLGKYRDVIVRDSRSSFRFSPFLCEIFLLELAHFLAVVL